MPSVIAVFGDRTAETLKDNGVDDGGTDDWEDTVLLWPAATLQDYIENE